MRTIHLWLALLMLTALNFATDRSTCGTLSVSDTYDLTANLNNASTCLTVTAANVTINCKGYSITGTNATDTYGIYTTQSNTTIINCIVSNFKHAIYFNGADNGTIQNVTANTTQNLAHGIILTNGSDHNLINSSRGFSRHRQGILVEYAHPTTSFNNIILGSNGTSISSNGIILTASNTVINNSIGTTLSGGTNQGGIHIYGGNNNTITNSFGYGLGAGSHGLLIAGEEYLLVTNNTFSNNQFSSDNDTISFMAFNNTGNTFINNTLVGNNSRVRLRANGANKSTGNTFFWNNFTGATGAYVQDEAGGNFYNSTVPTTCYQESFNVSNQSGTDGNCGLVYNGSSSGMSDFAFDGNWLTSHSGTSVAYFNYTKPPGYTGGTLQFAWDDGASGFYVNATACDSPGNNIQFKANVSGGMFMSCWNGSIWKSIYGYAGYIEGFTEEAMYWNISEGNHWSNVNGSNLSGTAASLWKANISVATGGTSYPYNNSTSGGKFVCSFAGCGDYAPLFVTGATAATANLTVNWTTGCMAYGNDTAFTPGTNKTITAHRVGNYAFVGFHKVSGDCTLNNPSGSNSTVLVTSGHCYIQANCSATSNPMDVHSSNRYMQNASGSPLFLIGSYAWGSIDPARKIDHNSSIGQWINETSPYNLSYIRMSLGINMFNNSTNPKSNDSQQSRIPFLYSGGKIDLDQWDETFWAGLRYHVNLSKTKGLTAHVSIFDGVDFRAGTEAYRYNNSFWNPAHHIRTFYSSPDFNSNGDIDEAGEFYQTANFSNNTAIGKYQRLLIDKTIAETKDYDNVMYELGNELMYSSEAWNTAAIAYIKNRTDKPITIQSCTQGNPCANGTGMDAWVQHTSDTTAQLRSNLSNITGRGYPAMEDPDGPGLGATGVSTENLRKAAWLSLTGGAMGWGGFSNYAFDNPAKTEVLQQYGYLMSFLKNKSIPFQNMTPNNSLVANNNSVLYLPGQRYVAYFPNGSTNNVSLAAGNYSVEWLHPATGAYTIGSNITAPGGNYSFTVPSNTTSDWVLHLQAQTSSATPAASCTHYASPTGTGNGSYATPMNISSFWSVATNGSKLCLLNGTYNNSASMIIPTVNLSGTRANPITVSAYYDGEVLIDGLGTRTPIYLDGNSNFIIEGIDAKNSSASIAYVFGAKNVTFRRIVGWDAAEGNTAIFNARYSQNVLGEDLAGFGSFRKMWQGGQVEDVNFNVNSVDNITLRRAWARAEYNTWGGMDIVDIGYNTNGNTVENAFITMDGFFNKSQPVGADYSDGFHDGRGYDTRQKLLGSIAYRTADQNVTSNGIYDVYNYADLDTNNSVFKDILVVIEGNESSYSSYLRQTGALNYYSHHPNFTATHLTYYGGPGLAVYPGYSGSPNISRIIVQNARWDAAYNASRAEAVPATGIYVPTPGQKPIDYVISYNNTVNWGVNANVTHNSTSDPNIVGRCGNLLQYGCTEAQRPNVSGVAVGAQIQCRYVDGVLTDQPLFPFPMDERIRVATCMKDYNKNKSDCQANKSIGVNVTKTLFELGGGSVPDFSATNPTVCPNTEAGARTTTITAISVVPNPANSTQNVSCNLTVADSPLGSANISGNWTRNGTVILAFSYNNVTAGTPTIVANLTTGNYTVGSNISCRAIATGSNTSSLVIATNVTIQGMPRITNITAIAVTPASPNQFQNLSCNLTATDNTLTAMNISGNWTRNGVVILPFTFNNIQNNTATVVANLTTGNYTAGSNISCRAIAIGSNTSSLMAATNVSIRNTTINISIALTPLGAYSNDTMNCTFTAYDTDSPSLTISWNWTVDGTPTLQYSELRAANLTKTDTKTIYQIGGYPGTVIGCEASANDSEGSGHAESGIADMSNTAPALGSPSVLPATLYPATVPWCNFTVTETDDQDYVWATVRWYADFGMGSPIETDTLAHDFTSHGTWNAGTPYNYTGGGPIAGESYWCGVNLSDSYGGTASQKNSSLNTVIGYNVSGASLTFVNASAGHWFMAYGNITDNDGGSTIKGSSLTISSPATGTCTKVSNSSNGINFQQIWNCSSTTPASPTFTANFTDGNSSNWTSKANTYPNSTPSLGAPSITPSSPVITSTLTCNAGLFSDADMDTENLTARTWKWYKNSSLIVGAATNTLNNSSFAVSDIIRCEQTATNSTWGGSVSSNSTNVTISALSNAYVINAVMLSQNPIIFNTSVGCLVNSTFANDTAVLNYEWYVNYLLVSDGTYTMNLTDINGYANINTLDAAYMDFGDLVLCQARIWNGSAYSSWKASGTSSVQKIENSLTIFPLPSMILLFWESWQVYLIGLFAIGLSWIVWGMIDRTLFSAALLCWVGWLAIGEVGLFYFGTLYFVMGLVARFSIGK